MSVPTGTITFLFTDIEGSTKLWERFPDAMRTALAIHDGLLRTAIERHDGYVFKTVGDAFCAAFATASDAVEAALDAHLALQAQEWGETGPLRIRVGLHTGEAQQRDNDYFGPTLNRVARLQGIGHGQQTLLSQSTFALVADALPKDAALQDLKLHRLKDLTSPQHVYQLLHPSLPEEFPPLRSLDLLPNNLPEQLTSFVGREKELADVKSLLQKTRLLTLTGSGGAGKTRLSLQVAADLIDDFADGVFFVELAPITDPALVVMTVASAIQIREEPGPTLLETLIMGLADRFVLLVLDNCEHLIGAAAQAVETLLKRCRNLRILASSREGMGIGGEMKYRVPSLALPKYDSTAPLESLLAYDSVQLFIERATFQQPAFTMTHRNAAALVSICRRLDGIPLAIELAAGRVRSMPLDEINTRLEKCFRLLSGGSRTALPRQQTLRALMDWSYDLLNAKERALFCRLSVFAGGWTMAAMERVCSDDTIEDWELVDLLGSLTDKSLVVYEEHADGVARYRLLETLRQYAWERLGESGDRQNWQGRHRDYYLTFVQDSFANVGGRYQVKLLGLLETEHDNLRQALTFCEETPGERAAGLRIAAKLWRLWYTRGYFSEGRSRFNAVLNHPENQAPSLTRAEALSGQGHLALGQGDYTLARSSYEESLSIMRELGNKQGVANSLTHLGNLVYDQGDYTLAGSLYEESLVVDRELGNRASIATTLQNLGGIAYELADFPKATALFEESIATLTELGDRHQASLALHNLGNVLRTQGDLEGAKERYREGLAIQREMLDKRSIASSLNHLGNIACMENDLTTSNALLSESMALRQEMGDRYGIAFSLEGFAALAQASGRPEQAARILGAAEALRDALGTPLSPLERAANDVTVAAARAALSDEAFAASWSTGRAMTNEQAIEYALAESRPRSLMQLEQSVRNESTARPIPEQGSSHIFAHVIE